ncbi:MAG: right-handed parallel beta-helix repeat-containing protein [Kiritimatiellae bacterium]|nr:right-handed parallel beta-helix repeat-containing protein [Kiritimatiellia bacterium]
MNHGEHRSAPRDGSPAHAPRRARRRLARALCGFGVVCTLTRAALAVTVRVGTGAELTRALAGAEPGHEITIENGVYSGSFTLARSGSDSLPIVIRPRNPGGVTFRNVHLTLAGRYGQVEGLVFENDLSASFSLNFAVKISGNRNRVTRCVFRNAPNRARAVWIAGRASHNRVDFCEITDWNGAGVILVKVESGMTGNRIDHNYIHDNPKVSNVEALHVGEREASLYDLGTVIEYNLVERVATDEENEVISVKSSGNTIRANTFKDCSDYVVNIRHGVSNVVMNNTLVNMRLQSYGDAHRLIGNRLTKGHIILPSGTITEEDVPTGSGGFPAARNQLVAGNILENGNIYVGKPADRPIPASGNTLAGNQGGAFVDGGRQTGTVLLPAYGGEAGVPVRVTPSMVGPDGADPGGESPTPPGGLTVE